MTMPGITPLAWWLTGVPCPRLAVPSKGVADCASERANLSTPSRPIRMVLGGVRQLHDRLVCRLAFMAGDWAATPPLREFGDSRGGPSWHSPCHILFSALERLRLNRML